MKVSFDDINMEDLDCLFDQLDRMDRATKKQRVNKNRKQARQNRQTEQDEKDRATICNYMFPDGLDSLIESSED